ncbi:MAG: hypothetical protein M3314_10825, partial [Actinomycetota bacterium]|nr:hypothetical protein [Actinomycetota bacterium]
MARRPPAPRRGPRIEGGEPGGRHRREDERGLGGQQVEGRQAVAELLAAGRRRVLDVCMAED